LYISDNTGSVYRIDFDENDKIETDIESHEETNDSDQDDSDEEEEDEPEDNPEKKPKKDGSGEGKRVNQGRGGCEETEEKGRGKEESEEKEDFDENKDDGRLSNIDKTDMSADTSPNLIKKLKNAIKNKTKGGCDMDFEMKETSETKPDGSEAMKERRITQCMKESGKSREACTKEVRKKMHENDAEAVNPEDMKEEAEEAKDTIEVCSDEYDFLKKQAEELKSLKAEKEKVENELESFKADFLTFKKKIDDKEASEREVNRQKVIKRISHDFDLPEEEMKDDSMEELEKFEKRLEMALKRDTEEDEKETFGTEEDFKEVGDRIHKRYFLEV